MRKQRKGAEPTALSPGLAEIPPADAGPSSRLLDPFRPGDGAGRPGRLRSCPRPRPGRRRRSRGARAGRGVRASVPAADQSVRGQGEQHGSTGAHLRQRHQQVQTLGLQTGGGGAGGVRRRLGWGGGKVGAERLWRLSEWTLSYVFTICVSRDWLVMSQTSLGVSEASEVA